MSMIKRVPLISLAGLAALGLAPLTSHAYQFDTVEADFQSAYLAEPVELTGRIIDEQGLPLEDAQLRLIGFGDSLANDGEATSSWSAGSFSLSGLARRSVLLEVSLDGYYSEIIPVDLQVEFDQTEVELGDIQLIAKQFGRVRMTFGGDAMFGRRMLDADADGLLGESSDLLHLDSLGKDTEALFEFVEPLLHADDHTAINLETPVTDSPLTPHPTKSYVFHAYSDSAAVLPEVGVDSVSLGNNHIFDFLTDGLSDSLIHLDNIGLTHYGAGMSRSGASDTAFRSTINGVDMSLQGFSNFIGSSYGDDELHVIAYDPDKAGALPSYSSQLDAFVDDESDAGRFVVPIIHGGTEYAYAQTSGMRTDFARTIEHGADIVVAHHPHVVHGIATYDGGDGPKYVIGSLGNFVFDQEVYETFRSYLAVVDVIDGSKGPEVERMSLVPFRLDDYAPRFLAGDALAKMGRHVAHMSTAEAQGADAGWEGAVVYAQGGRLRVAMDESEVTTTDLLDSRSLTLSDNSTGAIDIEPFAHNDALAGLATGSNSSCELGRDLLFIGDFEDQDVDDESNENPLWVQSSSRYVQNSEVHSGTGAVVLLRKSTYSSRTSLWMGNMMEITAGRKYTIKGWHKGDNAGEFRVTVRWMNSSGSTVSHTTQYQQFASDYEWSPFEIDVTAPSGSDKLKVYFRHYPPAEGGDGEVFLDDISIIEWDPSELDVDPSGVYLPTPNGWDAVRCESNTDELAMNLLHRVYE
ncbi:CapA family protein [Pseudenhygromyxa sp. WMMC2535]|uniref:CapA family protein n=1 Tax=Pseudenhygromyxa sp. WMMC2535 TaxID=2712867 RepID=UPI001551EF92|nr:CapA family protein [Pseudenhygromyxa sp. WMMC2535]NVB36914.1 CapA family protein [Pseudenhygromyxa sp. WMMC2535]